jgi:hypothetical protein
VFVIARHLSVSQTNPIHVLNAMPETCGRPGREIFLKVHKLRIIFGEGIPRVKILCLPEPYLRLFQRRHIAPYRLATRPAAGAGLP